MFIKDNQGRKFEYRERLFDFQNQILDFEGKINHTEKRGCRTVLLINDIKLDGKYICKHVWSDLISKVTKDLFKHGFEEGQTIKFRAKVRSYKNSRAQNNFGLEIKRIYW